MRDRDPKLIVNLTRGSVVCERGEIVERALARLRGLLGAAAAKGARAVLELAAGESSRRGLSRQDRLAVLEHTIRPNTHTRVLLVATDRRFRAAASALLAQRGCSVSVHDGPGEVRERAARDRAHVVVIDASSSLTAAARTAARLQTLRPAVGVVAVSSDPQEQLMALPLLPKWGSFDALFLAVQRARGMSGDE